MPGWDLRIPPSPESPASEADAFLNTTDVSQENHPVLRFNPSPRPSLKVDCALVMQTHSTPQPSSFCIPTNPGATRPLLCPCGSAHIPPSAAF